HELVATNYILVVLVGGGEDRPRRDIDGGDDRLTDATVLSDFFEDRFDSSMEWVEYLVADTLPIPRSPTVLVVVERGLLGRGGGLLHRPEMSIAVGCLPTVADALEPLV